MEVFLNGHFIPEERALVSAFDRGFLYGDGLFETVRVAHGRCFRWEDHLERLARGAAFLKLPLPSALATWSGYADELLARNHVEEAVLRLILSRGPGTRGYSPRGADQPTLVMSLHPAPPGELQNPPRWRLATSSVRLPVADPLSQFKTCNKLPQILARAEADASGADEALLLDSEGRAGEGSASNLFWIQDDVVCTPPLAAGVLPGITRKVVLEICQSLALPCREAFTTPSRLHRAQGVFLTLSSLGVAEAVALDGIPLPQSNLTLKLTAAYNRMLLSSRDHLRY
jgi:branched-chain amino acid aminotransferase